VALNARMDSEQVKELVLQSLEQERCAIKVYEAALAAARRADLTAEWVQYLAQKQQHAEALSTVCETLGFDPFSPTAGTQIVKFSGQGLLRTMEAARNAGDRQAAQIVACECVMLAEAKDLFNWSLLGTVAQQLQGREREVLLAAHQRIEQEEEAHLRRMRSWCRELWLQSLGLAAEATPTEAQRARAARHSHH
jgi:rubrerythrin